MQQERRSFIAGMAALGGAALVSPNLLAQSSGFVSLQPVQPSETPGKIEVLEFFSYGCPHCHDFHPTVTAWAAKLPADVAFRRVPVSFGRAAWGVGARLFYALEASGDLARLDNDVFKAIHNDHVNLFDERILLDWVGKRGVDAVRFGELLNSFAVVGKARRADQLAGAYRIDGVPSMAVAGKFMITASDFREKLAVADKLIARARSEKK